MSTSRLTPAIKETRRYRESVVSSSSSSTRDDTSQVDDNDYPALGSAPPKQRRSEQSNRDPSNPWQSHANPWTSRNNQTPRSLADTSFEFGSAVSGGKCFFVVV